MPCYYPLTGYRSRQVTRNGKRAIVFNTTDGYADLQVTVACGQCIGCRLERSRQWAVRCVHEASLYDDNCFITLTYEDKYLPQGGSLVKSDFQKFMKRLRFRFPDTKIRYFMCGEYGETFGRPHYHACIFNFDFPDKVLWRVRDGIRLYLSEILLELWPFGFSTIGDVTFDSAAYVARYVLKKITGESSEDFYKRVDLDITTGEIFNCYDLLPEYCAMSRRPGIGREWFDRYCSDVFPDDFVIVNGKKVSPPKYYNNLYELDCPESYQEMKDKRVTRAFANRSDNTIERLIVKEKVKRGALNLLKREIE